MNPLPIERILLLTDFGEGIYVGQVAARLNALAPSIPVIGLMQDLPPFRPDLAAYLLPALARDIPTHSLYLCIIDPGVGSDRAALAVQTDGCWLIGPDNGLLAPTVARAPEAQVWRIGWRPSWMSSSFHGRDWFAPAAARLCREEDLHLLPMDRDDMIGSDWPKALPVILYVDHFGNLITGLEAPPETCRDRLHVGGHQLRRARTFYEVPPGQAFWYENAFGLVEIAVNQGRADRVLELTPGAPIHGWVAECGAQPAG